MGTTECVQAWSKTAATNASADGAINWAEGQTAGSVNNSARSEMAAVAKYIDDTDGILVAGGTATALTITTNQAIDSGHIANGYRLCLRTASASGTGATVAIDGIAAKTIKKNDSSTIVPGDWGSGAFLELVYSSTATAFLATNLGNHPKEAFIIAASDETTNLAIATAAVTWRMPYAFTITAIRASLTVAQPAGSILTIDVNEAGTTIMAVTKLTIDNTELTSTTAVTAAVVSDASLADDALMSIDIDQVGTAGAKGLKVALIGYRT